jgi:hypothetical protein
MSKAYIPNTAKQVGNLGVYARNEEGPPHPLNGFEVFAGLRSQGYKTDYTRVPAVWVKLWRDGKVTAIWSFTPASFARTARRWCREIRKGLANREFVALAFAEGCFEGLEYREISFPRPEPGKYAA